MAKLRNRHKPKPPQDSLTQREQSIAARRAMLERVGAVAEADEDYLNRLAGAVSSFSFSRPGFGAPTPEPRPDPVHRTGKALGFRSWKLEGYQLVSANAHYGGWKIDEPTEAECYGGVGNAMASMILMNQLAASTTYLGGASIPAKAPRAKPTNAHPAPHPGCDCGLYALHAPEFMSRWHQGEPLMVHGAVLGWGRMEVHHEGWRAQYAQPVMLAFDGDRQPYNHCERVKAMGAELGLPVVEWPDFEAEARKLAEPVPDALRPKAPPFRGFGSYVGYSSVPLPPMPHSKQCLHCGSTTISNAPISPNTRCGSCGR
jgi:hypothetical protein